LAFAAVIVLVTAPAIAEQPVEIKFSRQEIEQKWRVRIQSFLDKGVIPLIDFLSFLPRKSGDAVLGSTMKVMDKTGVALISFAGYPARKGNKIERYRWGYYIHEIVNQHPNYFILTTNKGGNFNWWAQKGGTKKDYIDRLERHVRGGAYSFMGEIEFRHYPAGFQCKVGEGHRDEDVPINGANGHRVFQLSAETGVPFSIHHDPEDQAVAALEEMLAEYPKAKVIWAHFGQIRYRERQKRFGPELARRLLSAYPNLFFDLSTGEPGRYYKCGDHRVLDTVIWETNKRGKQKGRLKPAYKAILTEYSDRFVAGFDYGPRNRNSEAKLRKRIKNIRLIIRDLPEEAKHDIGYRTGWKLLTGKDWR
jgi:predicted TIM-barrel fold metal-dependent hydrolase